MFNKVVTEFWNNKIKYKYQLNIISTLLIWGNVCTCIVKDTTSQFVEHPSYRTDLIISLILLVLCTTYIRLAWGGNKYII